ncbi:phosphatase PAP2 family protein [Streptomyces sp. NPDC091209]|uniref:phosphatase PAP2 family protein n=1 Tax=Streptomyces sp. NPDC091209 TaxID=3365974 RepID=UPI0038159689
MDRRPDGRGHRGGGTDQRRDGAGHRGGTDRGPGDLDRRLLSAFHAYGRDPRVAAVARALSGSGEHGALWITAGLAGAVADRERRGAWLRATALTATAHLASIGVKRIVRRPRPPHVEPRMRTAGRHSLPSSHATSATAAAVAYGALGAYAVPPLAAAMCLSRLVVGVHYPTDVAAGAALGAAAAGLGARWIGAGHG